MKKKEYLSSFQDREFIIENIISSKYKENVLYKKFVHRIIKYIPIDYQIDIKIEAFSQIFEALYIFFYKKDIPEKIENVVLEKENFLDSFILCEYTPFLVDSLHGMINRLNLSSFVFLHPVIYSVRDENAQLKDICLDNNEKNLQFQKITKEHLIFIRFYGQFSSKQIQSLKSEIKNVINISKTTLDLWKKLSNSIKDITNNKLFNNFTNSVLNWLLKDNFTFLALIKFTYSSEVKINDTILVDGIIENQNIHILKQLISKSFHYSKKKEILFGKIDLISKIHRNNFLDYILIKNSNSKEITTGYLILGLYSGAMYFHSTEDIPMLKNYKSAINQDLNFAPSGYNAKKVNYIVESIPRDALVNLGNKKLKHIAINLLSSIRNKKLKIFIYEDWAGVFTNIIIFLRKSYLTSDSFNNIIKYLENIFGLHLQVNNMDVIFDNFILLYIFFPNSQINYNKNVNYSEIEKDLIDLSMSWLEQFTLNASSTFDLEFLKEKDLNIIFSEDYKYKFTPIEATEDLKFLYQLSQRKKTIFNTIYISENKYYLKIYTYDFFNLFELMPLVENIGLNAKSEQHFTVNNIFSNNICYIFLFEVWAHKTEDKMILTTNLNQNLSKMLEKALPTNILSRLTIYSNMGWKEILFINAIVAFFAQIKTAYSKDFINKTLLNHNKFTSNLIKLFRSKFDIKDLQNNTKKLEQTLIYYLEKITSIDEDNILNSIYLIIQAILRTNFYQSKTQENLSYISFKFDSSKVPNLPRPIPYREYFVYSNLFEGSHLRAGKIARGGIRWSDRPEDFRLEVLGLMRSQITKNTVIVPTGAKGIFYLKKQNISNEERNILAIESYKNFLRGLFDITDNIIEGSVVHPSDTKILDENDSYLVVAADKGTSSFSDYANTISKEYNFWLDDAFASGGSFGYDHKKMAITAKGAWISAKHHLTNRNFDYKTKAIKTIGIGDMSGDVFGNGMLLHSKIQLIAAFNHKEIFVDPNPDVEKSFNERKRLFSISKTSWQDYNKESLSKGGGIFQRSSKSLNLSKEMQELFLTEKEKITPVELIKLILTLKVDLIWNGGIGTYFKSSLESNQDIGDKENDTVRCNASQIKAKVIAEGGNLGISQLGRIEFASLGGHINTDFIDNSAGVSCSDHEVNVKIVLNQAIREQIISFNERNQILIDMSLELEKLVLQDNYDQNLALDILQNSELMRAELFEQLLKLLEQKNILDRDFEYLPSDTQLSNLNSLKQKLTRPELAIILSYSKLYLTEELSNNPLLDEEVFNKHLLNYFPHYIKNHFKKFILNHPLRNQIIVTSIVNEFVNRITGPLIVNIKKQTGAKICDIIKSYIIISKIVDLDQLWESVQTQIKNLTDQITKVNVFSKIINAVVRGIIWVLKNIEYPLSINRTLEKYKEFCLIDIQQILVGKSKEKYFKATHSLIENGIKENFAKKIASLNFMVSIFDNIALLDISLQNRTKLLNIYFFIGDNFYIDWLRDVCDTRIDNSYWTKLSIQSIKDDLYKKQKNIVSILIEKWNFSEFSINIAQNYLQEILYDSIFYEFILEIQTYENINISMLILANKKLDDLIKNLNTK